MNESIRRRAYEKFKLRWMLGHGYTLEDMIGFMQDIWNESKGSPFALFNDFQFENGFNGEIYPCYAEFLKFEYKDKMTMRGILSDSEYELYLEDVNE